MRILQSHLFPCTLARAIWLGCQSTREGKSSFVGTDYGPWDVKDYMIDCIIARERSLQFVVQAYLGGPQNVNLQETGPMWLKFEEALSRYEELKK